MGNSHLLSGFRRRKPNPFACLIIACLAFSACGSPSGPSEPPVFKTEVEGDGNTITLSQAGETTIFEVHSESGIGRGSLQLVSGTPPKSIVLHLYLTGLEQFRLSYGETAVNAALSTGGKSRVTEHLLSSTGGEQEVTPASSYWMGVNAATGRDFIEVSLPRDFFQKGTGAFSIDWVDFFR